MAVATITTVILQTWMEGKIFNVLGTWDFSASSDTYATGGITAPLTDPLIKAQRLPLLVQVQGLTGYIYQYAPGTTNANGKLKAYEVSGNTPLTEIAASAIPAAVSGDTITFIAKFLGQN